MLRHPSYQNGKQEEERRSPLTEEEEGMEGQHEMDNAITYSAASTNNHIKAMESQEMENAVAYSSASSIVTNNHISSDISRDDKEEETLPQDLSMISNRNVDS